MPLTQARSPDVATSTLVAFQVTVAPGLAISSFKVLRIASFVVTLSEFGGITTAASEEYDTVLSRSLAVAAADNWASASRRACSMTLFVSADEAVPKNANESRAKQTDRTNGFVFMVSSSPELNVASMLFQTDSRRRLRLPGTSSA